MSDGPSPSSSSSLPPPSSSQPRPRTAPHDSSLVPGLQPHSDAFASLSASARTSYTRVDLTGANTPRMSTDPPHPPSELSVYSSAIGADADVDVPAGVTGTSGALDADQDQVELPQAPQIGLTFLLVSGRRRSMAFEPETTIGRVKELVWNAWPNEWSDERPPAPSYLRILYLGKILQDDDTLSKLSFPTHFPPSTPAAPTPSTSTIVHLSIRSHAPPADDTLKKKKRRVGTSTAGGETEDTQAGSCCGCVIC